MSILQVFSPAKVVFAGVGVLLLVSGLVYSIVRTLVNAGCSQTARDVVASQDILVDIFGRIDGFFSRLEIYTEVPLTSAMTEKMVQITVELLDILAIAMKEMKQSRASEFVLHRTLLGAHVDLERFVMRVAGRTDLEDGLKKLDKLTLEEVAMASVQLLRITHSIDNKVTVVGDGVRGVDGKVRVVVAQVEDVKCDVQVVSDQVEVVDKRVQVIVDGAKHVFSCQRPPYKLLALDGKEAKLIMQQTADNVDDVMRS